MAFDFPNSPTTNQITTLPNGVQYKWDGTKWVPAGQANVYATTNSPTFTGNPTAPTPPGGDNSTSVATTAFVAPAFNDVGRNKLHNPLFGIAQRGAGPWTTTQYTLDRWVVGINTDTASFSQVALSDADRTAIGDEEATYCLQDVFTGSSNAAASHYLLQRIENVRRLSNKTVTISFWAKTASGVLKLGINMQQYFGTGGSPSSVVTALSTGNSVTISPTWTRYSTTITLPSISGKTLGTNNDHHQVFLIYYSSGANANQSAGNIGVQSGTVQLWGVQLEVGSVATPLEKPDIRYDIANCQRFYQTHNIYMPGYSSTGAAIGGTFCLPVPMRAAPTVVQGTSANSNVGTVTINTNVSNIGAMLITVGANVTATGAAAINLTGNTFSADL